SSDVCSSDLFSFQKNPFLRIVPVFIKYPIMRFAFNWAGESRKTLTLTNLGNVKLPDSMRPYVESMDIVLYPTKKSPINCGVATVNDTFTITFARAIEENDRSEEHTSELQSRFDLVCRLLLEK